jgi:hypothetical protein
VRLSILQHLYQPSEHESLPDLTSSTFRRMRLFVQWCCSFSCLQSTSVRSSFRSIICVFTTSTRLLVHCAGSLRRSRDCRGRGYRGQRGYTATPGRRTCAAHGAVSNSTTYVQHAQGRLGRCDGGLSRPLHCCLTPQFFRDQHCTRRIHCVMKKRKQG